MAATEVIVAAQLDRRRTPQCGRATRRYADRAARVTQDSHYSVWLPRTRPSSCTSRYCSELDHTDDRREAVGVAVGTAGSAVVFAGLTVIIALAALSVVRIPFLTSMGVAAAATVAVPVLVARTLLPAVLGLLKSKAFGGRVRRYRPTRDQHGHVLNNGVRWARTVGRAPLLAVLVPVLTLGAIAMPLKDLHLAFPTDSTAAASTTQRQAYDLVAEQFGSGRESPMLVVVDGRGIEEAGQRPTAYGEVVAWAAGQDDVANAQLVAMNEDGTGAQILVTPASGPEDTATEELLRALRNSQADIEAETGTRVGVTGLTAITTDVSDRLADTLPVYLAVVIGLAFLLLMPVFRSILIPLNATLGFLLSVLATLSATVAVFQQGTFGWFEGQPIVSFMPIFLIGVVFGLAMHYQVFLVTHPRGTHPRRDLRGGRGRRVPQQRPRRHNGRADHDLGVRGVHADGRADHAVDGVRAGGRGTLRRLRGADAPRAGVAVLMHERSWLPRWLDRVLPDVDVEGEKLHRPHLDDHYRKVTRELVP
jgi:RND superfamily putative drug exporter